MASFAYLNFLLTFVALGLFVHALATGSAAAVAYARQWSCSSWR